MKIVKRLLAGLIILLILVTAGVWLYLRSLVPDLNADLRLPGLKAPAEVLFDDYGIPHIYASDEEDLFYAFGYIHARDRLFQMEVIRRLADGRLSEVFGEAALDSDRFFRTLSFRHHAKQTLATTYNDPDAPFVKAAKAYLKGINHHIETGKTPVEFTLAGIPRTPFTLEDMEIIVGYMGYTFAAAFNTEVISTTIYNQLGKSYHEDVLGAWPDGSWKIPVQRSVSSAPDKALTSMASEMNRLQQTLLFPPFHGSNGWVISGKKTRSGKPILSNDTHIAFSQPSVWYEAHLECPGFKIYGNFLAGTPVPALGHTGYGGWGLTMFENDDADFYREKVNPENPGQVWYKDHWEPLDIRKETIRIKDREDQILEVKKSRHGYLLNGAFSKIKDIKDPVALWWVYHQFPSRHLEVFYNLSHARNATEAAVAVSPLTSPGLNFMWADTLGNIAWWAAGKIPVRPAHVNPQLILDGSTGLDDPLGWLDFKDNPQILNPERGALYTANNQPDDMGKGLVAGYYVPSNRARRIEELIFTDKSDWTEEEVRKVINDVKSATYPEFLADILPVISVEKLDQDALKALDVLKRWDGTHELNSTEPVIFYKFIYLTYKGALKDELGQENFSIFEDNLGLARNTSAFFRKESSPWWDNVKTPQKETRSDIFTAAFNQTVKDLKKQLGEDLSQWKWERVHTLQHSHPLGILPIAGKWFNVGPMPARGGRETINNLDFKLDSTGTYKVTYGPALRRIIDFDRPRVAYSVNPTGQSGYFMSKHYDDQARMFVEGGKRPELTDRKQIEQVSKGKTILRP